MNYQFFRDILDLALMIGFIILIIYVFYLIYFFLYLPYSLLIPDKFKNVKITRLSPLVFFIPISLILCIATIYEINNHGMTWKNILFSIIQLGEYGDITNALETNNNSFLVNKLSYTILYKVVDNLIYILPSLLFTMISSLFLKLFCSLQKHRFFTACLSLLCVIFINICTECNKDELFQFTTAWISSASTSSFTEYLSSASAIIKATLLVVIFIWAIGDFFTSDILLSIFSFSSAFIIMNTTISDHLKVVYMIIGLTVGLIGKLIRGRVVTEDDDDFDNYLDYTKANILYSIIYILVVIIIASGILYSLGS